jgi:hypothetical protein
MELIKLCERRKGDKGLMKPTAVGRGYGANEPVVERVIWG